MRIPRRLFDPKLVSDSIETLYTADEKTILKRVVFTNVTGSAATITAHIVISGGTAGTSNRVLSAKSINGNTAYSATEFDNLVMEEGDTLQAIAGTVNAIAAIASGTKVS